MPNRGKPKNTTSKSGAIPRLRLVFASGVEFGHGKAALLQGVDDTGSIAAAGRRMGMSYKRAWTLIETMNNDFCSPLVVAATGGARGGGASLTELGHEVLLRYRKMEKAVERTVAKDLGAVAAFVISNRK